MLAIDDLDSSLTGTSNSLEQECNLFRRATASGWSVIPHGAGERRQFLRHEAQLDKRSHTVLEEAIVNLIDIQ